MQRKQLRRREFVAALGGAMAAWPLNTSAQQVTTPMPRVGWLVTGDPQSYRFSLAAFRDGLQNLGWIEGQNIIIEYRWAEGTPSRLPALATDLVRQRVDVILAGGSPGAKAASDATPSIPLVIAGAGDLVELKLVSSFGKPGGNLTGFVAVAPETAAKRLQIIKEIIPQGLRAAILLNPDSPNAELERNVVLDAAIALQLTPSFYEATTLWDLESALSSIRQSRPDMLAILNDPFMFTHRKSIVEAAARQMLPAVYGYREYVDDGGFVAYGASISDTYRRAAAYVDRILKGDKPADLPVQAPTKFELVINVRTAEALGLEVPPMLLARADEVVE